MQIFERNNILTEDYQTLIIGTIIQNFWTRNELNTGNKDKYSRNSPRLFRHSKTHHDGEFFWHPIMLKRRQTQWNYYYVHRDDICYTTVAESSTCLVIITIVGHPVTRPIAKWTCICQVGRRLHDGKARSKSSSDGHYNFFFT